MKECFVMESFVFVTLCFVYLSLGNVYGLAHTQDQVNKDRKASKLCESEYMGSRQRDWNSCSSSDYEDPTSMKLEKFVSKNCFCDKECGIYGDCCLNAPAIEQNKNPKEHRWKCRFFDNLHVYMVQKCPKEWNISSIRDLCEIETTTLKKNGKHYTHLQDMPVHSKKTKLLYRNIFCSLCNEDTDLNKWNMQIKCYDLDDQEKKKVKQLNEKAEYIPELHAWRMEYEQVNFTCRVTSEQFVKFHKQFRRCHPVVSTCPESYADKTTREYCESFASYVYDASKADSPVVYNNFYCALCHGIPTSSLRCNLQKMPPDGKERDFLKGGVWYPFVLDFGNIFSRNKNNWVGGSRKCSSDLEEIYDPVFESCFKIHCGRLYRNVNGRCVPISDPDIMKPHLKGLLTSDCVKIKLSKESFTVINDSSIYVNESGKLYTSNEFEIFEIENGTIVEILICTEGENLLHFNAVQGIISEILIYISIVALIMHLFVYLFLPMLRNLPGKTVISFSFSLLIALISFVIGGYSRETRWLCKTLAIIAHLSYLCSFFWMNVMAYDAWRSFKGLKIRNLNSPKTFFKYSLYAWWTPITITLFAVIFDFTFENNSFQPYYGTKACWINQKRALLVFFSIPLALILIANGFFFIFTAHNLHASKKQTKIATKGKQDKIRFILYVKLVVIVGFTWIFGFLASFTGVSFLWYPFIILNGLQGFLIFLVFTLAQAKKVWPRILERLGIKKQGGRYLRAKTGQESDQNRRKYASSTFVSTQLTSLTASKSDLSRASNVSLSPSAKS